MTGILSLPVETIEEIMDELDIFALDALSRASSVFFRVSNNSKALWATQARKFLDRWIALPVPTFQAVENINIFLLRSAIRSAVGIQQNLVSGTPCEVLSSSYDQTLFRGIHLESPIICTSLVATKFLLTSRLDGQLIVRDAYTNEVIGDLVFNPVRWIENCAVEHMEDFVKVTCYSRPSALGVLIAQNDGQPDVHGGYHSEKIHQFYFRTQANLKRHFRLETQELATFVLPSAQMMDAPTLLDASRRLFATVLSQEQASVHIFVLYWETGKSFILDLSRSFDNSFGYVLSCFPGREEVFFRAVSMNKEYRFAIKLPEPHGEEDPILVETDHILSYGIPWAHENRPFVFQSLFHYPWNPEISGRPNTLLSTCIMKKTRVLPAGGRAWELLQYYSTGMGPYGNQRCIIPIRRPHIRRDGNSPVIALTFRHAVWIEIMQHWQSKQLRLATFRPPQSSGDGLDGNPVLIEASVITLDVPAEALEDPRNIVFDEGAGVIVIINEDGQTFTVRFAEH